MRFRVLSSLVNIAHFLKLNRAPHKKRPQRWGSTEAVTLETSRGGCDVCRNKPPGLGSFLAITDARIVGPPICHQVLKSEQN
jgi:hypothetical protein